MENKIKNEKNINKVYEEIILNFENKNKKFPYYETLIKDKSIKGLIELLGKEKYNDILLKIRLKELEKIKYSSPLMKRLLKEVYKENNELFKKFMLLNFNKEIGTKDFQEIGEKIKILITDIENYLFKKIEGGKYKNYSLSLTDKFYNYLKKFFPLYNNIGVKIFKASNIKNH